MHSASSVPTHAKDVQAGLQKVLYTLVSGFSRNVFPVFAGPQIITFRNLLRPFSRSSFIAFVKVSFRIPFCCNTSHAQASHCPLQPSIHSPCATSYKIWTRVFSDLSSFCCAFRISHAVVKTSETTRGPLLMINSAMSFFPSHFWLFA